MKIAMMEIPNPNFQMTQTILFEILKLEFVWDLELACLPVGWEFGAFKFLCSIPGG